MDKPYSYVGVYTAEDRLRCSKRSIVPYELYLDYCALSRFEYSWSTLQYRRRNACSSKQSRPTSVCRSGLSQELSEKAIFKKSWTRGWCLVPRQHLTLWWSSNLHRKAFTFVRLNFENSPYLLILSISVDRLVCGMRQGTRSVIGLYKMHRPNDMTYRVVQKLCPKNTIENKTTSVTAHFKKLATENHMFIVSVIV